MVSRPSVLVGLTLWLGMLSVARAEIYRLVGADGSVTFTNAPVTRAQGTSTSSIRRGAAPAAASSGASARGANEIAALIRDAAARHGLSERLVSAVIAVESGFNPRAVSRRGARGLMQLMPDTAALLGVRDVFDPADNVEGGVRHLRRLLDRLGNDLALALAAYNAGERAVAQHGGIPPYPETQEYVARIMRILDAPPTYGGPSRAPPSH